MKCIEIDDTYTNTLWFFLQSMFSNFQTFEIEGVTAVRKFKKA